MIYIVAAIHDRCGQVYAQPFFSPTIETAIRSFRMLINDEQGGLPHTNPDDFSLFHLGSFDDQSGRFSPTSSDLPNLLALARDMIKPLPLARG